MLAPWDKDAGPTSAERPFPEKAGGPASGSRRARSAAPAQSTGPPQRTAPLRTCWCTGALGMRLRSAYPTRLVAKRRSVLTSPLWSHSMRSTMARAPPRMAGATTLAIAAATAVVVTMGPVCTKKSAVAPQAPHSAAAMRYDKISTKRLLLFPVAAHHAYTIAVHGTDTP